MKKFSERIADIFFENSGKKFMDKFLRISLADIYKKIRVSGDFSKGILEEILEATRGGISKRILGGFFESIPVKFL